MARSLFSATAPLLRHYLLELGEDPSQPHPPLLAKFLKVDSRIVQYVLGSDDLDDRIRPCAMLCDPQARLDALLLDDDAKQRIGKFISNGASKGGVIVYLR